MKVLAKKKHPKTMMNLIRSQMAVHINQFKRAFKNLSFEQQEELCKSLKKEGIEINLYHNPTPVAVAIVKVMTNEGIKILTVTRGLPPCIGELCLPGGYVDSYENAQMAAARELFEETGLDLAVNDFTIVDSKVSQRNTILIFCEYNYVLNEVDIDWSFKNEETLDLSLGNGSTNYCFNTHNDIMYRYFN